MVEFYPQKHIYCSIISQAHVVLHLRHVPQNQYTKPSAQIHTYDAEVVFEFSNSNTRSSHSTILLQFRIKPPLQKLRNLSLSQESPMTVCKLTDGLRLTEAGTMVT